MGRGQRPLSNKWIATQFAGNRQQSRFLALVSNVDLLKENIANAENSEDVGTLQALKALDSLESKINQVQVAYQQFYTTVGIESVWKTFLDGTKNVIDTLNGLPKLFGKIPATAIVVVSNLINVIKVLLVHALKDFSAIYIATMREVEETSGNGGEKTANNWIDRLIQKIRARKSEIQAELNSTVTDTNTQNNNNNNNLQNNQAGFLKKTGKYVGVINGLSAALSTASLLLNKSTENNRKWSASLMGVSGALKGAGAAAAFASGQIGTGISMLASSILEITSAIGMFQESLAQRAERLAKEAEEATNEAKKLRAETNTLASLIEKIKQLREERLVSTQATEEYQEAINELADSFPQLIAEFDTAGNAIDIVSEAEEYLASMREKTAKATYTAAEKEREAAEAGAEEAVENFNTAYNTLQKNGKDTIALLRKNYILSHRNDEGDYDYKSKLASYSAADITYANTSWYTDENYHKILNILNNKPLNNQEQTIEELEQELGISQDSFIIKYLEERNSITSEHSQENYRIASELLRNIKTNESIDLEDSFWKGEINNLETYLTSYSEVLTTALTEQTSNLTAIQEYQKSYIGSYNDSGLEKIAAEYLMTVNNTSNWSKTELDSYTAFFEQIGDFWNSIENKDIQKELTKRLQDRYHYSGQDIISYLEEQGIKVSYELRDIFLTPYREISVDIGNDLNKLYKNSEHTSESLRKEVNDKIWSTEQFTEYERQFYAQVLEISEAYGKMGLEQPNFAGLLSQIEQLPTKLQDQILANGFKTKEGIEQSIALLRNSGYTNESAIIAQFTEIQTDLLDNLFLSIQTKVSDFNTKIKDKDKEIGKMTSGMDIDEALQLVESAKSLSEYGFSLNYQDFINVNGKLVLTAEKANNYWKAYISAYSQQLSDWQTSLAGANKYLDSTKLDEEDRSIVASLLVDKYTTFFNENGELIGNQEEYRNALTEAIANASDAASTGAIALQWATEQITESNNWKAGDYSSLGNIDLKQLASNNSLGKDAVKERAAKENINKAYSSLLSDVLSKGFENINLADYDGLIAGDVTEESLKGSYKDFVENYGSLTGKTAEELNALYIQAMQKDSDDALKEAAKGITKYSGTLMKASRDTLGKLADALNMSVKDMYKGGPDDEGNYQLSEAAIEALAERGITEYTDILNDSFRSAYSSINDLYSKALSGTLSGTEATSFVQQLKNAGIEMDLKFTQTAEGLKLSTAQAIELYNALKNVAGLQSQITFQDLVKHLQETNKNYETISSTLARIAELNKLINDTNKETDSAKLEQYKAELEVAEKIAQTRALTDDNSFKWMDRKMDAGMANPINYFESAAKANKVIKDANKSGFMDVQDFNAILMEMGAVAEATGNAYKFWGQDIKNLADAQNLVTDGMVALTELDDGTVKLSMEKLGASIGDGSKTLDADINSFVKDMAQQQINLLDAEIAIIQGMTAFDEIEFNLGEDDIFNVKDIEANSENLLKAFEALGDGLEVEGEQLLTIFNSLSDDVKNQILTLLYEISTGDYGVNGQKVFDLFTLLGISLDPTKTLEEQSKIIQEFVEDQTTKIQTKEAEKQKRIAEEKAQAEQLAAEAAMAAAKADKEAENAEKTKLEIAKEKAKQEKAAKEVEAAKYEARKQAKIEALKNPIDKSKLNHNTDAEIQAEAALKQAAEAVLANKAAQEEANQASDVSLGAAEQTATNTERVANSSEAIEKYVEKMASTEEGSTDAGDATPPTPAPPSEPEALVYSTGALDVDAEKLAAGKRGKHDSWVKAAENLDIEIEGLDEAVASGVQAVGTGLQKLKEKAEEALANAGAVAAQVLNPNVITVGNGQNNINNRSGNPNVQSVSLQYPSGLDSSQIQRAQLEAWQAVAKELGITLEELLAIQNGTANIQEEKKNASAEEKTTEITETGQQVVSDLEIATENLATTNEEFEGLLVKAKDWLATQPDPFNAFSNLSDEAIIELYQNSGASSQIITKEQVEDANKLVEYSTQFNEQLDNAEQTVTNITENLDSTKKDLSDKTNYSGITDALSDANKQAGQLITKINILNKATGSTEGIIVKNNRQVGGDVQATGNAFAAGKTLMGELGPELYVTGGHYYVAGQNGAEFVDLPSDAIVFNHKQTQRLLSSGYAGGHGRPVTNENKAIAHVSGNVSGPAKASAGEVLAELKKLRSMWQSLLDASIKDIATKGGSGGGGKSGDSQKRWLDDVERWYNLLQEIDKLERQINREEAIRSKLSSDMNKNGAQYYESQKRSLQAIEKEAATQQQLAISQREYFKELQERRNTSAFSQFYTFDDEGQLKYTEGGFKKLAQLVETDDHGRAKMSNKERYEQILEWDNGSGELLEAMMYDENGERIEKKEDEDDESYYARLLEAFWNRIDDQREEMQSLHDSIDDAEVKSIELLADRNQLLQDIKDNQLDVEQTIFDAIVDMREAEIKEMEKQRDAIRKASDDYINGLNDSLNKERQMYENNQSAEELNSMRRRLDILQRTGGSASQISSLQKQIQSKEQDTYFDERQQQIDAVKEASDLQLERLDHQIEIMQETLAYEQENGLLWGQVAQIMQGSAADMMAFVTQNAEGWKAKSPADYATAFQDTNFKIAQWEEFRKDYEQYNKKYAPEMIRQTVADAVWGGDKPDWNAYFTAIQAMADHLLSNEEATELQKAFEEDYNGDINAGAKKASDTKTGQAILHPANSTPETPAASTSAAATTSKKEERKEPHGYDFTYDGKKYTIDTWGGKPKESAAYSEAMRIVARRLGIDLNTVLNSTNEEDMEKAAKLRQIKITRRFKSGGLIDFTGPAWVDGTKSKPEGILNAEQLDMLRNSVLTKANPIVSLLNSYNEMRGNLANENTYNTIDRGESFIIEKAEVNMNVSSIANDYDARRAGASALDEMMKIARKTGTRAKSRR